MGQANAWPVPDFGKCVCVRVCVELFRKVRKMTRQTQQTPTAILTELDKHYYWTVSPDKQDKITFADFKRILMFESEFIGTERVCKEKWKNLIEFGIFKGANQYSAIVDIEKVRAKIKPPIGPNADLVEMALNSRGIV